MKLSKLIVAASLTTLAVAAPACDKKEEAKKEEGDKAKTDDAKAEEKKPEEKK